MVTWKITHLHLESVLTVANGLERSMQKRKREQYFRKIMRDLHARMDFYARQWAARKIQVRKRQPCHVCHATSLCDVVDGCVARD